ncbi:hypothetical protein M422DRAFT_270729 [Sphaerobolus stellatus SS14]|uniref:Uncharacterized protein n=1 Tax=Sphaerobolus stellatus (strain SS14) TaxID=990650 RepID=A0A0C9US52_SPHS4|nr:hypothetical protein M422DRAFT_270729 [Sphaerobolus stellatus SS14]
MGKVRMGRLGITVRNGIVLLCRILYDSLQQRFGKLFKPVFCTHYLKKRELPSWQRPNEYVPKSVERLSHVLEFNENGEIITSEKSARVAAEKYLTALWALVPDNTGLPQSNPIPWLMIRKKRNDLHEFVEPGWLLKGNFIFERPKDCTAEDLLALIRHIIKGEHR